MLRRDLLSTGMLLATGGLVTASAGAAEEAPSGRHGLQVNHVAGKAGKTEDQLTGTFAGSILITHIALRNATKKTFTVRGFIQGTVNGVQGVSSVANQPFKAGAKLLTGGSGQAPAPAATCPILRLDIGAIHLDLLGLVIDLAPIHLNITAQSGPGKLLGNLLCALANLLNANPLNLTRIQQVLGRINQILQTALVIISGL
jgi:hypothetical protein